MSNKILMPVALTAENGAKSLLIGEFHETISIQCNECGGEGEIDEQICDECEGAGSHNYKVSIGWDTAKDIYATAVKHLGENQEDTIAEAKTEAKEEILTYLRDCSENLGCPGSESRILNKHISGIERLINL